MNPEVEHWYKARLNEKLAQKKEASLLQLSAEIKGHRDAIAERLVAYQDVIDEMCDRINGLEKRLDQAATAFSELKKQVECKGE